VLLVKALEHFEEEALKKVATGQATIVDWDTIKEDPPPQMKVSPIAAIPHKSKAFRLILDLPFLLRLWDGTKLPAVNDPTTKMSPTGRSTNSAICSLGHLLQRVIHAFAEADESDKIFMAKWDIKDGFWRLDAKTGDEWNFACLATTTRGTSKICCSIIVTNRVGQIPPILLRKDRNEPQYCHDIL
jgi:hypothetical protein